MNAENQVVYTTCRYCESCCGLAVEVAAKANRVVRIKADQENPGSWRDICNKGLTANEVVEHPRRLRWPMKRVGERYVRVSYEEAVAGVASDLRRIMDAHGPDAIGSYFGNPVGFGSDVVFSLGLIDGIGTKSRYSAASLDQNNQHVVSEALFGYTFVPFSPDVEACDYLVLVGGNPLEDIRNAKETEGVFLRGRYFGPPDLDDLLAEAQDLARSSTP